MSKLTPCVGGFSTRWSNYFFRKASCCFISTRNSTYSKRTYGRSDGLESFHSLVRNMDLETNRDGCCEKITTVQEIISVSEAKYIASY